MHIVPWDPARVLAECDAKRNIVELHTGSHECSGYNDTTGDFDNCLWVLDGDSCTTLRLLATPCSYHPDYRQEWAP